MAIDFGIRRITIPRHKGAFRSEEVFRFARPVRTAHVALNGFDLDFTQQDHRIDRIAIDAQFIRVRGNEVDVTVTAIFRDKLSDDSYEGFVDILVVADLTE